MFEAHKSNVAVKQLICIMMINEKQKDKLASVESSGMILQDIKTKLGKIFIETVRTVCTQHRGTKNNNKYKKTINK